jgi:hypothetical protein
LVRFERAERATSFDLSAPSALGRLPELRRIKRRRVTAVNAKRPVTAGISLEDDPFQWNWIIL